MDALLLLLYLCIPYWNLYHQFLNVVIWRLPQGLSFVKGRSFCPSCHHQLQWYDLFPVFSYLFLKGNADTVVIRFQLVKLYWSFLEAVSGCFVLYLWVSWDTVLVFAVFMILLTITMIDFDTMTIPKWFNYIFNCSCWHFHSIASETALMTRAIGFFIVSLPMYLLTLLIRDCFWWRDIKLIAVAGFLLGWKLTSLRFLSPY